MPAALSRIVLALSLALGLLLAPGCENKVTAESFDQIENGMDMTQVEDILGGPGELQAAAGVGIGSSGVPEMQQADGDTKSYLWGDETTGIIVKFEDGKVTYKRKIGM